MRLDAHTRLAVVDGFVTKDGSLMREVMHRIRNSGDTALRILCCCAPAYSHDDTELL